MNVDALWTDHSNIPPLKCRTCPNRVLTIIRYPCKFMLTGNILCICKLELFYYIGLLEAHVLLL